MQTIHQATLARAVLYVEAAAAAAAAAAAEVMTPDTRLLERGAGRMLSLMTGVLLEFGSPVGPTLWRGVYRLKSRTTRQEEFSFQMS